MFMAGEGLLVVIKECCDGRSTPSPVMARHVNAPETRRTRDHRQCPLLNECARVLRSWNVVQLADEDMERLFRIAWALRLAVCHLMRDAFT
jgi:hypothetical protein